MKKRITFVLALALVLSVAAGCGLVRNLAENIPAKEKQTGTKEKGGEGTETVDPMTFKTVGEALTAAEEEGRQYTAYLGKFVFAFRLDGTTYRVIAPVPDDLMNKFMDLDFFDEAYDRKVVELMGGLPLERIENVTAMIPPQAQLDKLTGRTGQELLDEGWQLNGYNLDEQVFYMEKGLFVYEVAFEGKVENSDDLDAEAAISALKVRSVTFLDYGDLGNIDDLLGLR